MIPWLILLLLGNDCCWGSLGESSHIAFSHQAAESFPEANQLHLPSAPIERNMPLAFDCESPANQLGALSPDSTRDEQNPQLLGIVIDKQEGHCAICLENVDLVADSSKIHHCTICKQPFHLYCSGPWLKLHALKKIIQPRKDSCSPKYIRSTYAL
ncbi:hypothetical protein PGTUg99_037335 [Puccinia graminis f. sp. tritici]|uniref:RING-type domain-containing protein n=1 Tax=Puccinia graminis f. sp. tritici TaxID=56615 RepID=A0A5B0NQT7_PUCGR|nr:hypothetical protein PGTUg99_037335 [Puccinia graminis f. sp. tritici]